MFLFLVEITNNWAGFQGKQSVKCKMRQMEDLKISLINFKVREISLHFSKIDCVKQISTADL